MREALRALDLEALAGRPIQEIFLGLADYVCPNSGTIDDGIARDAFIETIAELAAAGVTDMDGLTRAQMLTVFELFAANAIAARLCNDIGTRVVLLPTDPRAAARVQAQLHDFIRRGVSDALARMQPGLEAMVPDRLLEFTGGVYEEAFRILQLMGDAEGGAR